MGTPTIDVVTLDDDAVLAGLFRVGGGSSEGSRESARGIWLEIQCWELAILHQLVRDGVQLSCAN